MRRRAFKFFLLFTLILLGLTGYLKGCDSTVIPSQKPITIVVQDPNNPSLFRKSDTLVKVAAGPHYDRGGLHQAIFGKHYRELWAEPIKIKVFDINQVKGGLKIIEKGGSMQTLNLRLKDQEGKVYVLRTVDKDNSKALPSFFRNKLLNFIIRDQTSALHPYGALVVAHLANAAGIYHTNPELYFISNHPNLGEYSKDFEGRIIILEEQPDKTWLKTKRFGKAEDIISTENMLTEKLSKQEIEVDQYSYAKARIFDLLINDWDRHADQWRWAEYTKEDKIMYVPIPRDRDMAFFQFRSGIIPTMVPLFNSKFQSFDDEYGNIEGLSKNAERIDHLILNDLTEEDFIKIAKELQESLSDAAIRKAVCNLPDEVYQKSGKEIMDKLISRRNDLLKTAMEYYKNLFREVLITGTDEDEVFRIERISDHETKVIILNKKDEVLFEHTYQNETTKEINLYGLKGEDSFFLTGNVKKGITINIYGGEGKDKLRDHSSVKGYSFKTRMYDSKGNNDLEFGTEAEDRTSNDPIILYFDRSGER